MTEIEELKRSRTSLSAWKLHADSLVVLVNLGKHLAEGRDRLGSDVGVSQRTKSNSVPLYAAVEKLRERIAEAANLIAVA